MGLLLALAQDDPEGQAPALQAVTSTHSVSCVLGLTRQMLGSKHHGELQLSGHEMAVALAELCSAAADGAAVAVATRRARVARSCILAVGVRRMKIDEVGCLAEGLLMSLSRPLGFDCLGKFLMS